MSNTTDRRGPRSLPRTPLQPLPAGVRWHPSMLRTHVAGTVVYRNGKRA